MNARHRETGYTSLPRPFSTLFVYFKRERFRSAVRWCHREWALIAVTLAIILAVTSWFGRGNYIFFIDSYFPFSPSKNLTQMSGAWTDFNGVGTLNVSSLPIFPYIVAIFVLHSILQVPLQLCQVVIFVSVELLGTVGMYLLVREVSFADATLSRISALGAAAMFAASPVTLTLYWYLNFPADAGFIAAAPALVFFFLRGVRRSCTAALDISSLIAIGILSIILGTAAVPYVASSAIIVVLALAIVVPRIVTSRHSRQLRNPLAFVGFAVGTILGVNAYWLVPDSLAIHYITGPNAYSPVSDLWDLTFNSRLASPLAVATLQYFPAFNQWAGWASAYQHSVELSILLPVIVGGVIIAALLAPKRGAAPLRNPTLILGVFGIYLALVLLVSGNNVYSPTAEVYLSFFQNFTLLVPFLRGPYLSFGPALTFCSAILFGVGLGVIAGWVTQAVRGALFRCTTVSTGPRIDVIRRSNHQGDLSIVIAGLAILLIIGTYSAPFWNGTVVTDLGYPATPIVPQSTFAVAKILNAPSSGGPAIVYPVSTGYTLENWSSPYLGPPVLPFSGGSVLENVIPPLGSITNYIVPMAFALPAYNNSVTYGQILQLLGMRYAVVDNAAGFDRLTIPSNVSTIKWTLNHTQDVTYWRDIGQYSLYEVNGSAARVYAPAVVESDNLSSAEELNISWKYAISARNVTDLSAQGLWTSTAQVVGATNSSFNITAYWPNSTVRNTLGTGFHFPGWAEVTNFAPLNIELGRYPLVYVWVKTISSQVNPQVWFSGVPELKEYTGNITQYDRTLSQFSTSDPVQITSYAGGRLFVYNLASSSQISTFPKGVLNHIMIELQPLGNYTGSMNASVSIGIGAPPFLTSGFAGGSSVLVGNPYLVGARAATTSPPPQLTYVEHSPSSYSVHVSGSASKFVVVLEQTYDSDWQIQLPSGAKSLHFVANDFANGWIVTASEAIHDFTLVFGPQRGVIFGTVISFVVLGGILIAAPIQRLRIAARLKRRLHRQVKRIRGGPAPHHGGSSGKATSRPEKPSTLRVAILARTLWPGSFARIAIEETSGLSRIRGVVSKAVVFSKVSGSYTYDDLILSTGATVEIARTPSILRRASQVLLRPFTPWIRDVESVVPIFEMVWWALFDPYQQDVIYCEDQFAAFPALLRNRLRGTPYSLFLAEPISHPAGIVGLRVVRGPLSAQAIGWAVRTFEQFTLRYAHTFVFVSARTLAAMMVEFPQLVKTDAVKLYPGCNPDPSGPTRSLGLSYFLCASKWDSGRHPEFAIEIVSRLRVHIILAGSWVNDDARHTFEERYIKTLPVLKGRVTLTGSLDEEELLRTYRGAYAYLQWNQEGFGMGALESMACGVPPICIRGAGASELLQDGVSGIIVESDDPGKFSAAMESISNDVVLRNRLAEGAWNASKGFSWERHNARLFEMLRGSI